MKKRLLPVLIFIFCLAEISLAQNKQIDSLNNLLKNTQTDSAKLSVYIKLCDLCDVKDNLKYAEPVISLTTKLLTSAKDSLTIRKLVQKYIDAINCEMIYYSQLEGNSSNKLLECSQKQLSIAQKYRDPQGIADATIYLANYYYNAKGDAIKKYEYLLQGYEKMKQLNFKRGISKFVVQLSYFLAEQGDTAHAIDYMEQAKIIEKEINDSSRILRGYYISAKFYSSIRDYKRAIGYFRKGIEKSKATKNDGQLMELYYFFGKLYEAKKDFDSALVYYDCTINLCNKLKEARYYGLSFLSKADVIAKKGNISEAITQYNFLQKLIEKDPDPDPHKILSLHLANTYFLIKQFEKAIPLANKALFLAYQSTFAADIYEAEYLVYKIDSALKNYTEAFIHYQKYIILKNQFENADIQKKATQEKFKEEINKQKDEQAKKDALAASENRKQKVITASVVVGLLLVLVFAGFVVKSLRVSNKQKKIIEQKSKETEQQKHVIEEKQLEIIDSITYAKRLQQAILPSLEEVKKHLPNSFVYYQPKDIVAGDFYWTYSVNNKQVTVNNNTETLINDNCSLFFIAAADCTGHGVPGAMVSVVCSNALNRAVNEFNLTDTALILDKTRELVIETFEKSDAEVKDGMDISLLRIENLKDGKKQIQWSGANNSLWYVLNNELIEVKADKQPIGKYSEAKPFTANNFTFNEPVTFYLFSDGYADQFSPDDKKLMKKKFKDIVLTIQDLSMEEQKNYLDKFHSDWKGVMEQTDDVLVIGIKI